MKKEVNRELLQQLKTAKKDLRKLKLSPKQKKSYGAAFKLIQKAHGQRIKRSITHVKLGRLRLSERDREAIAFIDYWKK